MLLTLGGPPGSGQPWETGNKSAHPGSPSGSPALPGAEARLQAASRNKGAIQVSGLDRRSGWFRGGPPR